MNLLGAAVAVGLIGFVAAAIASSSSSCPPPPSPPHSALPPTVFAHYYPWYYGPPNYYHWRTPLGAPPGIVQADYYPTLGAYDSADPSVLAQHMSWLSRAGVDCLLVSWWGQASPEDQHVPAILAAAAAGGLKVAFTVEPYTGRTSTSFASDVAYLLAQYGHSPALYRASRATAYGPSLAPRPLILVYLPSGGGWSQAIDSLRGTANDCIVLVRTADNLFLTDAGVRSQLCWTHADGMYNYGYFANPLYPTLPRSDDYLILPSVSPGFDNSRENGVLVPTVVDRQSAGTLAGQWQAVLAQHPEVVAVVSFNEWHEGTQIEPAQSFTSNGFTYKNYVGTLGLGEPACETAYLDANAHFAAAFKAGG